MPLFRPLLQFIVSILTLLGLISWLTIAPVFADTQLRWVETAEPSTVGFERAIAPRPWNFPKDFGPHEGFQTEWWYYTGNLKTEDGRPFGFQLTFFRQAIAPQMETPTPSSNWRGNQIYSAHFTLSDIADNHFYESDRFSRGRIELAGASSPPYHVWLEDWSATELEPGKVQLHAKMSEGMLDLVVTQTLPPILQGDRGLSIKGNEPGNASYYYSLVQQPTQGTLTIGDRAYPVTGLTWKDHEYSTSSLSQGTVGWDWFSLQFDNGSALMLYGLRREDGTIQETSSGKFIQSNGETISLNQNDWTIQVLNTWKSPKSQAVYPAKWAIAIPKLDLTLQIQPMMANQELNTQTATYWEGAVAVSGTSTQQSVQGNGYVELTGYADRLDALLGDRT